MRKCIAAGWHAGGVPPRGIIATGKCGLGGCLRRLWLVVLLCYDRVIDDDVSKGDNVPAPFSGAYCD